MSGASATVPQVHQRVAQATPNRRLPAQAGERPAKPKGHEHETAEKAKRHRRQRDLEDDEGEAEETAKLGLDRLYLIEDK